MSLQPDLFSEAVTPPVVAPGKTPNKITHFSKEPSRTAAHCRELAAIGAKAGCSQKWCESYTLEADAIDAASGKPAAQPMRKAEPVSRDVAALGKSEWQKFLDADPRRRALA